MPRSAQPSLGRAAGYAAQVSSWQGSRQPALIFLPCLLRADVPGSNCRCLFALRRAW